MRRWAMVLGVLVLAVFGYGAAAAASAGRAPRQAQVRLGHATVQVGGLTRAEVESRLTELEPQLQQPVQVDLAGSMAQVVPAQAGMGIDRAEVAEQLTARTWNPITLVRRLTGRQDVTVSPDIDRTRMDTALKALAPRLGSGRPVEGTITMVGTTPKLGRSAPGRVVNVAKSGKALQEGWDSPPVKLAVDVTQPQVDDYDVNRALRQTVRPAMSGPLLVKVTDRTVSVPAARIAPALTFTPQGGQLAVGLDPEKLNGAVLASSPELGATPKDAQLVFSGGRPTVVPARMGVKVDATALSRAALPALQANGAGRVVTATTSVVQPRVTTAALTGLGIRERISDFATAFPYNPPRTANIRRAVQVVNGTVLRPGETFSLNDTLGERTAANGYHKAAVIEGGNLVEGYGGGVSQVATTLFNGMFFAGLQDVEHKPHSMYFKRYPEGREATLAWGATDLKFRNDSTTGVYIRMWTTANQVHVQFWGTRHWDITSRTGPRYDLVEPVKKTSDHPRCIPQTPQTGFSVTVTRVFSRGGAVVRTERFRTRYNAEDEITCTAPGRG